MRGMLICLLALLIQNVAAHDAHLPRPDAHAPIGVMADHAHAVGEWMLSYRFMHMEMAGNRKGSDNVYTAEVLADYMVSPISMDMDMHMIGAMYAFSHELTLMVMLPYVELSMVHVTRTGTEFTTKAAGIGDIKISALYKLLQRSGHRLHLNFGVDLPGGNVDEHDDTPLGNVVLPYPMQTGSGTYSLVSGLTYNGQIASLSWGGQVTGTFRLEKNDENYSPGDRFQASGWLARRWNQYLSTSLRVDAQVWGNVDGVDNRIAKVNMMGVAIVPTAQTDLRGGSRIDLLIGANLYMAKGILKGHRLAIEAGVPLQQNLDGPQLETDWLITVGWQKAF